MWRIDFNWPKRAWTINQREKTQSVTNTRLVRGISLTWSTHGPTVWKWRSLCHGSLCWHAVSLGTPITIPIKKIVQQYHTGFQSKQKQLLWPITRDEESSMNQSEFEVIASNLRQARENARETIYWLGLASHWKKARVLSTNHITKKSTTKANAN